MKPFKDFANNKLNESGLSRIWTHMKEHDCGIISAERYSPTCGNGKPYTNKENLQRTRSLASKLHDKRYDITSIKGSYIENFESDDAKEVDETVFLVVDVNNSGKLFDDLKQLGEQFEQDSIMFIPKYGSQDNVKSILFGTNRCPNGYPGYGISKTYTQRLLGGYGQFFTKVKNRPFVFKEDLQLEHYTIPQGFFGRYGCNATANTKWQDIQLSEED